MRITCNQRLLVALPNIETDNNIMNNKRIQINKRLVKDYCLNR